MLLVFGWESESGGFNLDVILLPLVLIQKPGYEGVVVIFQFFKHNSHDSDVIVINQVYFPQV